MQLRDVMSQDVHEVTPRTTLQAAACQMRDCDIGSLPVCEGGKLIGMITDRDITIRSTAAGQNPAEQFVKDAMTPQLVYCYEDEEVQAAAKLMEEKQIRRLAVVDRNKRLKGIVSLGDLALRQPEHTLGEEVLEQVSQPGQWH